MMQTAAELKAQRATTKAFIAANSTLLTLIPRKASKSGTGTTFLDQPPRFPQRVALIDQSTSSSPTPGLVQTSDGRERMVEFILIADYDANVEVHDYWTDASGTWEVAELFPANNYELRAKVVRRA